MSRIILKNIKKLFNYVLLLKKQAFYPLGRPAFSNIHHAGDLSATIITVR
jgi:hypothetical protein